MEMALVHVHELIDASWNAKQRHLPRFNDKYYFIESALPLVQLF